jgi:prepilin-type processing-associated H-X9-DG protein
VAQGFTQARQGFTLRELFWVCLTVAGLVGLLIPLAQTRESAKHPSCTTNLLQIGRALAMYTSDYNDRLPPYAYVERGRLRAVPHLLDPYLKNVALWQCPSRKGKSRSPADTLHLEEVEYGYNWLGLTRREVGVRLDQVPKPGTTVAFVDAAGYLAVPGELVGSEAGSAPVYRHGAGKHATVSWLDGHVTSMRSELDEALAEPFTAGVTSYPRWNIRRATSE